MFIDILSFHVVAVSRFAEEDWSAKHTEIAKNCMNFDRARAVRVFSLVLSACACACVVCLVFC